MPSILVVEQEGRYIERIHDALSSEGWHVKVVNDRDGALRAAAAEGPTLLLVSAEVAGARDLLAQFSRQRGGPGTVALVPESQAAAATATDLGSDDLLAKPFTDQDLRLMVRRCLNAASRQASEAHAAKTRRLTAQEIFGDVLAEVEGEAAPAPAPAPAAPRPAPPRRAARAAAKAAGASALDKQLEATLSGLRESAREARPKPAADRPAGTVEVEALLKQTLAGLERATRAKPAGAPAPPPAGAPGPRPAAAPPAGGPEAVVHPPTPPVAAPPTSAADEAFRTQQIATLRPAPPSAPREFGQYTLLERVAVGGMAEVWKARMKGVEGFQKTVAIKKILSHLTDSVDFVTMFIDEAKLAAQLTHDNIIHIYDLGKIGEDYYIAMEYVDGRDLRSILNAARAAGKPLPLPLALFIAARLASALDHAHRKRDFENRELGLVHRDVSPQNVLIGYEGEIKLCDFGIVKAVSKASKTQLGALKGKLQYMSPEQAWGKPVDARSDLFSLGAILFEMLTARRLFAGDSEISVLEAVREGRIERPRDVNPAVAPEVDALVVRALAKDPDERFQSAGEMQRELERILSTLRAAPTQSDLAAYLRSLFGDVHAVAPEAGAPAAAAAVVAEPAAARLEAALPGAEVEAMAPALGASLEAVEGEGKRAGLLVAAIAAALVAGVALWLIFGRARTVAPAGPESAPAASSAPAAVESEPAPSPAAPAAETALPGTAEPTTPPAAAPKAPPAAPAAPAAKPAAPAPAPQSGIDQEAARREAEMRQKLEADRRRLEEQMAGERAAAEAAAPAAAAPPPQVAPAAPPPAVSEEVPAPSEPAPPVASEPPAPVPSEPPATTASEPAATGDSAPPLEAAPAPTPETAPPAAPAPAPVEPPKPTVTVGELVRGGPGVRPPVLVTVPKPAYPPIAQRMRVEGVVAVEVLVDEDGAVRDARLAKRVAQDVGLNEAALAAAQKARFKPATKDGVRVRMWYTLTFPFQL